MMRIEAPVRVRRSYVQHLEAPPEEVFPLLCPVREAEWVEGWDPIAVYSFSGVAENDCVFVTPDGDAEAVWTVITHDPQEHVVEFVKVTPGVTACRIHIALAADGNGGTEAEVSYQHTALSERGRAFVADFTEEAYQGFMRKWEEALNRYLLEG